MDTPAALSKGQKILAACGIFLFVGGLSGVYAFFKPYKTPAQEAPVVAHQPTVPETLNPQPQQQPTQPPIQTGAVVPAQPSTPEVVTGALMETANDATGLEAALQSQGFSWREDLAWDRAVFDDIFPLAHLVSMRSYLVYEGKGTVAGRITFVESIDPSVTNVYDFLLMLARRDTSGRVTITETTRGRTRIFEYKDLDKTQNLRIVGQVSDKKAFAADLPAYLQPVMDAVLSQL